MFSKGLSVGARNVILICDSSYYELINKIWYQNITNTLHGYSQSSP